MRIIFCCLLAAIFSPLAFSQSERAQEIQRVIDGLNSADAIVRLVTFEEAMASDDAALRRMATQSALSSDDENLRALALPEVVSTKKSVLIEFEGLDDIPEDNFIRKKLGGALEVFISNYDDETDDFQTHSLFSGSITNANGARIYKLELGSVSSNRVTFSLDAQGLYSSSLDGICQVSTVLEATSTRLEGDFTCKWFRESYPVSINLLK